MNRLQEIERLVRRLRSDRRLFDENDEVANRMSKVLALALKRQAALRRKYEPKSVGPYSGLTRQELRQSRTLETDWY